MVLYNYSTIQQGGVLVKSSKKILLLIVSIIFLVILVFFINNKNYFNLYDNDVVSNHDKIVIYSPLNEEIIIPIVKEFQEITGIQVEYLSAGTVNLLNELEKNNASNIDIIWGSSKEYLDLYIEHFEPYKTVHNHIIHNDFNHENYYWNGFNLLPIVLMYNKKLVSEEEVPKSWYELLDPKWKSRTAYADPNNSGSSFMILSSFLSLGRNGEGYNWENVEKFIDNIDGKMLRKSSQVYNGIANGDFALGITMEEAAIRHINNGADVGIIYLKEGTPVITDAIALMKDAKNKDNSKIFIDFVLSEHVQKYMVDYFSLRSIRTDIIPPEGLIDMDELNILNSNCTNIYKNKAEILKKWDNLYQNN